jgi:signal transduction histidine kinase
MSLLLRYLAVCFFFYIGYADVNAQTKTIDNLKKTINKATSTEQRLQAIFALCEQGYSLHPDTLMAYAEEAKEIAASSSNKKEEVRAMYYESFALTTKGLIDSSLSLANQCVEQLKFKIFDPILLTNVLNQKGRCYMRKSHYKEAIDMGYQVIERAERTRDTLLQMKGKTLIGWAYLEMGQTDKALNWHLKALQTTADTNTLQKYGILFANLALNYNGLGKTDSGLHYIHKAIDYSRRNENLFALSNSLAIQAQLYVRAGKNKMAESPLKEMVEIRKLIGDPFYIVSDMSQLSLYYAHNGQPEKGIALCEEGIIIAKRFNIDTKLFFLYSVLAENYKAAGNNIKYAEVLEKVINLKDSVYSRNSAESLAEMQTRYEVQKKENLIIRQKLDLTQKNYLFYGLLLIALFAAAVLWILFRSYRRKEKIKLQLLQAEERRMSAEAIKAAEENERKRIAADLHDSLGAYAASIAANLDHIATQEMSASGRAAMQQLKNNSQSIVSQLNDTIWVLKKDALPLTAISDRLKAFIQRVQSSYPLIKMDVVEKITNDYLLSPSQAFHLFQILQEAINNAVRHSGCNQVTVCIESEVSWKIVVQDDGRGIGTKSVNGFGNGLSNMKSRADESGWDIFWKNGEGTQVVIGPAASTTK